MKTKKWLCWMLVLLIGVNTVCAQTEPADASPKSTSTVAEFGIFVTDGKDRMIGPVTRDQLSIKVNGKPVTDFKIKLADSRLLTALAVDNSGSMRMILPDLIDSAKKVVGSGQNDEPILLMRFVGRDQIAATKSFTTDKLSLYRVLDSFYIEGGQTALIDAIYKGVELLTNQTGADDYRKVMILLSDGEDRDSIHSRKQLLELLDKSNVKVVFIGLVDVLDNKGGYLRKSPREEASGFIDQVTMQSGGFVLYPESITGFPALAAQVLPALRQQTVLEIETPSPESVIEIELSKTLPKKKYRLFVHKHK